MRALNRSIQWNLEHSPQLVLLRQRQFLRCCRGQAEKRNPVAFRFRIGVETGLQSAMCPKQENMFNPHRDQCVSIAGRSAATVYRHRLHSRVSFPERLSASLESTSDRSPGSVTRRHFGISDVSFAFLFPLREDEEGTSLDGAACFSSSCRIWISSVSSKEGQKKRQH